MDDLRGWWDRTRRRKLKTGVQVWVDKVRPASPPDAAPRDPIQFPIRPVAEDVAPAREAAFEAPAPEPEAPRIEPEAEAADAEVALMVEADAEPEAAEPEAEVAAEAEPEDADADADADAEVAEPEAAAAWWETEPTLVDAAIDPAPEGEHELPADLGSPVADVAWAGLIGEAAAEEREPAADAEPAAERADLTWAAPGAAPWESAWAEPAAAVEPAAIDPVLDPEPADPWAIPAAPPTEPTASDPWTGITWSTAEQPAPWSDPAPEVIAEPPASAPIASSAAPEVARPEPAAPAQADPLGLDDDQRRWLDRNVELVEGIGPGYGRQLESVGITTLLELLLRGATRRGRQEIADRTGISGKLILRWVNNADLFRIRGVGTQYADLLEAAGVDTVVELALRRPENLVARLQTTNEIRSLVRQVPSEDQVADWVAQAKRLPRIVAY